ncbi:MAG TPA: hypothetical protein VEA18_00090 [Candidatus Kapabacteria bacterium]|nr:hypothetical protein [Candidatus Kapabacteria bacterium]
MRTKTQAFFNSFQVWHIAHQNSSIEDTKAFEEIVKAWSDDIEEWIEHEGKKHPYTLDDTSSAVLDRVWKTFLASNGDLERGYPRHVNHEIVSMALLEALAEVSNVPSIHSALSRGY